AWTAVTVADGLRIRRSAVRISLGALEIPRACTFPFLARRHADPISVRLLSVFGSGAGASSGLEWHNAGAVPPPFGDVGKRPIGRGCEVVLAHDVVAVEDRTAAVAAHCHGDSLRHASPHRVADSRAPHVVEQTALQPGGTTGSPPRLTEISERSAVSVKNQRTRGAPQGGAPIDQRSQPAAKGQHTRPLVLAALGAESDPLIGEVDVPPLESADL